MFCTGALTLSTNAASTGQQQSNQSSTPDWTRAMRIEPVLHSFAYCLGFLRQQVADVAPADMVRQPNGIMNHPAWVIGHLTFTCQMLGGAVGVPAWLPADWARRFGPGNVPVADVSLYEPKEDALAMLGDAESRITHFIGRLDDSRLDEPFPDPSYLEVFPTIRHAITQVLVGHTAYHVGQLPIWRKAIGLPRTQRSFE